LLSFGLGIKGLQTQCDLKWPNIFPSVLLFLLPAPPAVSDSVSVPASLQHRCCCCVSFSQDGWVDVDADVDVNGRVDVDVDVDVDGGLQWFGVLPAVCHFGHVRGRGRGLDSCARSRFPAASQLDSGPAKAKPAEQSRGRRRRR